MKLRIDRTKIVGKIKPMNAVNNGPKYTDNADQNLTNLPAYRDAMIPFARTHDASIDYSLGGEHTVDVKIASSRISTLTRTIRRPMISR